jgi:hypothetical protein
LTMMFRETGFEQVEEYDEYRTIFGTLSLWRARCAKEPPPSNKTFSRGAS